MTSFVKYISRFLLFALLTVFISCELNDDEDFPGPEYDNPVVNLDGTTSLELGVSQFINIPELTIAGSVGITRLVVSANGDILEDRQFDGSTGTVESSFRFRIPEAWFGTTRDVVFTATDTQGNTGASSLSVTVSDITPQYVIEEVTLNGQNFSRITGTINFNETLDSSVLWLISGEVNVSQQTTLTITEGTQIFAETEDTRLNIEQLALVDWQGTASDPIVFDAIANAPGQGEGSDDRGQWSGIQIEGAGGTDSSGTIRYIRLMFPGSDDDSFQFTNVGNSTVVEYIQIYRNGDNGFRINEGTVNLRYLVSTNPVEDEAGIRWDDLWMGAGQFWVVNMLEDGDGIQGRDGTGVLSNITVTGVGFNDPSEDPDGTAILIRNLGNATIYNALVTGVDRSLRFRDEALQGVAFGTSFMANSISFGNDEDDGTGFHSSADFFNPTSSDYNPIFNNSVDPITITDSYLGTSTDNSTAAGVLDPFFEDVNYVGAVPADNDWTVGWCLNLDGSLRE